MKDITNPSPTGSIATPQTYIQQGDRYHNSDNIPLALQNYQRALALDPSFALAHERIGIIYQQQGNVMEAIASFSRAVQVNPQSWQAQLGLGNAYHQKGWSELAIPHFQKALSIAPDRFLPEYHYQLGNSLRDRQRIIEAIASYEKALAINPNYIEGYRAIAQIHLRQNDPESVHMIYERANAYNSELLQAQDYNALGVAWLQKIDEIKSNDLANHPIENLLGKAIASLHQAILIDPAYADAHCNLGTAFVRQGQIKDAILAYKEAIDINPGFARAYFNLGILLNNLGKLDEAIACFQSAIELVPNWVEAHQYLGKVLNAQCSIK